MCRKWLPTLADLIDRLTIHQLKEVLIPENKEKYAKEMRDIAHDIDILLKKQKVNISADLIRTIVVLAQINTHMWYNESEARKGNKQSSDQLRLTHGLNGLRNKAGNYILELIDEKNRMDWKVDCLAEEFKDWEIDLLKGIDRDKSKKN